MSKNPTTVGILNFFFPGIGYLYNGIGRDKTQIVFGILVFVFYFIGFEVTIPLVGLTSPPAAPGTTYSPYATLVFLAYLGPFAFAYDGYRRAKSS
jgi:hypothetical protein